MADRAAIAAALGSVADLDASATIPDVIVAGSAWPELAPIEPEVTMACVLWPRSWFAYVALPNATRATSIEAADALLEPVGNALFDAGIPVRRVETISIQTAPGASDTIPALRYTLA